MLGCERSGGSPLAFASGNQPSMCFIKAARRYLVTEHYPHHQFARAMQFEVQYIFMAN